MGVRKDRLSHPRLETPEDLGTGLAPQIKHDVPDGPAEAPGWAAGRLIPYHPLLVE